MTKSNLIKASEAIKVMCHVSERTWDGTIYTIRDIRHPEYDGKQILVTLSYGEIKANWM